MNKLKQRRNLALFGILILVMIIAGIFVVGKIDRFKGLVKIKDANIKLLSDVSVPTNIKGTEEVKYEVKYTLDTIEGISKRDVVIKGELNSDYARFKEINNKNISSVVSNDGKTIELTIKNVTLGKEQKLNLKINVVNAPNNEEIKPVIEIKESTGEYTKLETEELLVQTNSIEGIVYDENALPVKNIELSLYKDSIEVKRTYTNKEGRFVFSDLEEGNYIVRVEEDIYELSSDSRSTENNTKLILMVKEVDRFNIELHKYVSALKLVIDGKTEYYTYEDVDKVVKSIKKFNNVSGEIEYKIVVQNNSDRPTEIKVVIDDIQEGLSFDKNKNDGWEIIDNKVHFTPLEGVVLNGFEKRETKITLDIKDTKELKTYLNKLTTKGVIDETVVFILDGKEIRRTTVQEGNKVSKPLLDQDIIWYTDRNKTNEYNFDREVTRDLILYGSIREVPINNFIVTYVDQDNIFYEEEIEENTKALGTENIPTKAHNIFLGWYLNDELFNFDTLITSDLTLNSKYEEVEAPTITYTPGGWTNDGAIVTISSNHDDYTYMYKIDDGDYTPYTTPFTMYENGTVYTFAVKSEVSSIEVSTDINCIDKINPLINLMEFKNITPISVNVNLKIQDEQSGLDKYRIYVDNVLVFESLSYSSLVNEEKTENTFVGNLDELNTYVIKLEVLDVAGNITSRKLSVSTPMKHYVARTLNYNGEEIRKYESLNEAISSDECTSSCHIEMIDDVIESNIVSQNQNIVLDLNGKTITGTINYALYNKGTLNIVDTNEDYVGKVYSNNTAIINESSLIIGTNETEPIVSDTQPIIEGSVKGISTTGILNYYDGHIIGATPLEGLVTNTPFLYNTIVDDSSDVPYTTLLKVADAVAVINSTYYTEAQAAINRSNKGYEQEVDYTKPLMEQLRSNDEYRFVYDETSKTLINDNRYVPSTLAHSYIKLDLTNYTDNQMLTVNAEIDGYYYQYGYVTITDSPETPTYDDTSGRLIYITRTVGSRDYKTILEKGKIYYLHIGYQKDSSKDTSKSDIFRINKITLGNFESVPFSKIDEVIMYNDLDYYSFVEQDDGSYLNNNITNKSTKAHSYFIVDLTNVDEDKYIYVAAETTGPSSSDKGWITVTNSITMPSYGGQVTLPGNNSRKAYYIELTKNKINVVHFCYERYSSNGEGRMLISDIKPVLFDEESDSSLEIVMQNNGTYYFEEQEDGSYVSNNKGVRNTTANSYILIDLTNNPNVYNLKANVTISSENNCDIGYITLTDSPTAPGYNDATGNYYSASGSGTSIVTIDLAPNKANYIHFGYRKDTSVDKDDDSLKINSLALTKKIFDTDYLVDHTSNTSNIHSGSVNVPVLNQTVETVKLVKNVTMTQPLEIINTRDVILDLNGKTLDTSANDYVIKNDGSLTIIDSDYENRVNINTEYKLEQARLFEQAKQQYLTDKAEYEEYAGLCENCEPSDEYKLDNILEYYDELGYSVTEYPFDYTNGEQTFDVPTTGIYTLETWGAQGGSVENYPGGYGGYSVGSITLDTGNKLYINVGGAGLGSTTRGQSLAGGYNGGGSVTGTSSVNHITASGGGATHIATTSGELKDLEGSKESILIVSGGGGGSREQPNHPNDARWGSGGSGGGFISSGAYSNFGTQTVSQQNVCLATQDTGYAFGEGESITGNSAGGGGYYGGYSGASSTCSSYLGTGSGGSGYIANNNLTNKAMYCYNCSESSNESTKTISTTCISENPTSNCTKSNNGYAKITYIMSNEEYEELRNNLLNTYTVKTRPIFKDYLNDIDFDNSIDIYTIDPDDDGSYNNTESEEIYGNVYSSTNSVILNNYGAYLDIEEGNVTIDKSGAYEGITNRGNLTLGDNAYVKTKQPNNRGIYNTESGDILDGSGNIITYSSTNYGIFNKSLNDNYIKGYNLSSNVTSSYGFYNQSYNDVTIDNITSSGQGIAVYQDSNAKLNIYNSNLSSESSNVFGSTSTAGEVTFNYCNITSRLYNNGIKININNSQMISNVNAVPNGINLWENIINNKGTINLNNTTIINNSNWHNFSDINTIENYATLNIDGGSIIKSNSTKGNSRGIYNRNTGIVTIKGNFEMTGEQYGIYNFGSVTLGDNSNNVSDTYPVINANDLAIYSKSGTTFNFYDGKLIGPTNSVLSGIISDMPDNCDLNINYSNSKEIITLKTYDQMRLDNDYVAAIGNNKYVSIQEAIDAAPENTETRIDLLKNIDTLKNSIIPENKNIILNLNNHSIKAYNSDSCFTNNGIFKINKGNSSEENAISANSVNKLITNNEGATLTINGGIFYSYETKLIENAGTIVVNSGKIYTTRTDPNIDIMQTTEDLINNTSTGEISLNGGEFEFVGQGSVIYNQGIVHSINPTVNLNGYTFGSNYYVTTFINNATSDSYANITGGTYGSTKKRGVLVNNAGTAELTNVTSDLQIIAFNTGSLTITGGTYNSNKTNKYDGTIVGDAGTITVDGVTIVESSQYKIFDIKGSTNVNISNSVLKTVSSSTATIDILHEGSGTVTLVNNSIISTSGTGIRMLGSGTMNLISGSVSSDSAIGVYVKGTGTLNIGSNDQDLSIETPSITGKTYGLYNESTTTTVNFYDGIISGETAIFGSISSIADGYEIILQKEGDIEHKYLGILPIVSNKRTGTPYYSIQEAIDYASDGDILELLREYTTTPSLETIENDKNITLDLMGYTIYQNNETFIINNGTLTIKSSVDGSLIESNSGNVIVNNGTVTLNGVTYHQTTTDGLIKNNEGATLTINGGNFYSYETKLIENAGTMIINSGKIYTTRTDPSSSSTSENLIYNASTGEITLNGGEFTFIGQGAIINNEGTVYSINPTVNMYGRVTYGYPTRHYPTLFINNVTSESYASITGGTYGSSENAGMLINNTGTAIITDITSNLHLIAANSGSLTITGGEFNTQTNNYDYNHAISSSGGTVIIDNIIVNEKGSSKSIFNIDGSTVATIKNSTCDSKGYNTSVSGPTLSQSGSSTITLINNDFTAIRNVLNLGGSGTVNIVSGEYKSNGYISINVSNSVTINLGTNDHVVSNEDPRFVGGTYGLYNNTTTATINFYDGIISGTTAIYGSVTTVEDGYDIILETENNIEYKTLGRVPLVQNARTGTPYYTIQEAIDYASDGDTLELLREYTTTPSLASIENDKNITIDLKGFKIYQNTEVLFINDGALTVKTSEPNGMIISNSKEIFINNGTLNILSGSYTHSTSSLIIKNNAGAVCNVSDSDIYSNKTNIIENSGTMNITSSSLRDTADSNSTTYYFIVNNNGANMTITDSQILANGIGAFVRNYGSVQINNATGELIGYKYNFSTVTYLIENNSGAYAEVNGGVYGTNSDRGSFVNNSGTAVLTNVTSNLDAIAANTGNLTISGGTYNTNVSNYGSWGWSDFYALDSSAGTLNLDGTTISEETSRSIRVSGTSTLNITNGFTVTAGEYGIILKENVTANIVSGKVVSTNNIPISVNDSVTLNVGTLGGIPSTTVPIVQGKTYAIYNNSANSKIYFYDGVIKGETGVMSGSITDYEPGYKETRNTVTDPDTGITTIDATLTIISDDSRAASVDNVNFTSLQSAVNYAVANNIDRIDLYHDIDLTSDLIKPSGIDVNIYLNGYSILGNYLIDEGIHLIDGTEESDNNLGASIYNYKVNTKNIVIYELGDGSSLSPEDTYSLYKLDNGKYETIKLSENRIGNYDIGDDVTELHTVNGRIYINNIEEGNYKLVSSNNKEISFEVLSEGVSSNIRINDKVIINRVVEAIAVVILQIQTGNKLPITLFIIISIIIINIFGLMILKKHKRI